MTVQPVAEQYPDFYELVRGSQVYSATTAVSGVAPGTAIGTTGAFTLQNLAGSSVNLVILQAFMGYVSGTLGAGVVNYLVNGPTTTVATGTAITPVNNFLGGVASTYARAFTTSTIVSPTLLRPFCSLQASLASTAVGPWQIIDQVNGGIIVTPGSNLTLHATAAGGSTPLVIFGMTWAEVSIAA
jgi:hypothetical protein